MLYTGKYIYLSANDLHRSFVIIFAIVNKLAMTILLVISHLYPAMFAAINSADNYNVKAKPGNVSDNNNHINKTGDNGN